MYSEEYRKKQEVRKPNLKFSSLKTELDILGHNDGETSCTLPHPFTKGTTDSYHVFSQSSLISRFINMPFFINISLTPIWVTLVVRL